VALEGLLSDLQHHQSRSRSPPCWRC